MEQSLTEEKSSLERSSLRRAPVSQKLRYPEWQREFEAALAEGDAETLRQRVDAAEGAIFMRLQKTVEGEERLAINEAIQRLRAIQKSKLGYPDWNKR